MLNLRTPSSGMWGYNDTTDEKGWGPWERHFFSICSQHQVRKEDCNNCQVGHWKNIWLNNCSLFFHKHCHFLWYIFVNRKVLGRLTKRFFT